jgi:hypothetical protein
MDNPNTLTTWVHKTQDEENKTKQNTTRKNKHMSNTNPPENRG